MAAKGNKVVSGCAVTEDATPDLTIDVAAGTVIANGIVVAVGADAAFAGTPNTFSTTQGNLTSGQSEFVFVHVDSSGTITNTEGGAAAAGQQQPPDIPEDETILAMITLSEGDTLIETVDIEDWRQFTPDGIALADNKKIFLGDDGDVQFYHNGGFTFLTSNSRFISSSSSGTDYTIRTGNLWSVQDLDDSNVSLLELVSTAGARTFTIGSSADPVNVGIGVAPTSIFQVNAVNDTDNLVFNSALPTGGTTGRIRTRMSIHSGAVFETVAQDSAASTYLGVVAGASGIISTFAPLIFSVSSDGAGAERMRIDTSGNVGIAVTPESALSFTGAETNNTSIRWLNSHSVTTDAAISTFDDASGTQITIGSNFYVNGSGSNTRFNTGEESAGITISRTGTITLLTGSTGATAISRMIIDSAGLVTLANNLLVDGGDIGITADTDLIQLASGVVTVNGNINVDVGAVADAGIFITSTETGATFGPTLNLYRNTTGASSDVLGRIEFDGQDDGSNREIFAYIESSIVTATAGGSEDGRLSFYALRGGALSERLRLTGFGTDTVILSGQVQCSSNVMPDVDNANDLGEVGTPRNWKDLYIQNAPTVVSALRYKQNVKLIPNALDKINKIRGVTYTSTKDDKRSSGMIADDFVGVLDEVVSYDGDGLVSGLKYSGVIPLLVEAIKELRSEVKQLRGN